MHKPTQEIILEGDLDQTCKPLDSYWLIEDNGILIITLEKADEMIWKCIFKGEKEIDTTKVDNSKNLTDFDDETQGAVRKLVFDENQKRQGKPTSEQEKMHDVMKKAWNAENSPFAGTEFDPRKLDGMTTCGDWNNM